MKRKLLIPTLAGALGLAAWVGVIAVADTPKDAPDAPKMEMKLPPGWTEQDMKACMEAGTPGKNHELLTKGAGTWTGKNTMWMGPDTEPTVSDCTATVTPIMDGRYIKVEWKGDMAGMGPFHGGGVYGFDNVSQKFVSAWIDNHSTGIMNGTGDLSADGKTLTWNYTFNCPITKKQQVMREIETFTGPDSKTFVMYGTDPKSGKEYKMMSIELTRKAGEGTAGEK